MDKIRTLYTTEELDKKIKEIETEYHKKVVVLIRNTKEQTLRIVEKGKPNIIIHDFIFEKETIKPILKDILKQKKIPLTVIV